VSSALEILWVEKYRPKSLDEIVNQKEIVERLKKFVEEKNMPHLLFAGPPGTGKTTAAHALAHDLYGENYRQYMLELNASIIGDTPVLVRRGGKVRLVAIGDLVDSYIDSQNPIRRGDGEYARVGDLEVLSLHPTRGVSWGRVSYVARHTAPGYIKVRMDNGGEIGLTGNHSIYIVEGDSLRLISASELRVGDKLVTFSKQLSNSSSNHGDLSIAALTAIKSGVDSNVFDYSVREREAVLEAMMAGGDKLQYSKVVEVAWLARVTGYRSYIEGESLKVSGPLSEELEYVEVVDIEEVHGRTVVYDLSVPGVENFFAGTLPVLVHNSDERGINVIREKVKEFARSRTPPGIPFKIILLDEADNMTADAQQALRRLMELFTASTRFILIANYPSKIIDPIQSRCAFFRFTPLKKEDVIGRLKYIAEQEGVDYDEEALEAIYEISEGDMRKAINILQSSAYLGRVTVDTVYKVVGMARPREVREMIQAALKGDFMAAREMLRKLMIEYGLSGEDVVRQIHREIFGQEIKLPEDVRVLIADYLGEIHFRLVEGSDDDIQLSAFLAWLAQIGKSLGGRV
jgi:replication factor C small subunit